MNIERGCVLDHMNHRSRAIFGYLLYCKRLFPDWMLRMVIIRGLK